MKGQSVTPDPDALRQAWAEAITNYDYDDQDDDTHQPDTLDWEDR